MTNCNFNFQNANFIVTGASSGIGRQITEELATAGARVLAVARRGTLLEKMHSANELIIPAVADVTDYDEMKKVIDRFVGQYGKINGGVYAAGVTGLTVLRGYDEKEAVRIMDVSFWAGAKFMQMVTRGSIALKGASFVMFSSMAVDYGFAGLFAYNGAKAATGAAVRTFAKELAARHIRVNAISPGVVKTAMTEEKAVEQAVTKYIDNTLFGLGKPEDIGGMVLFLLSDRSSWITGSIFNVDGGYSGA